MPQIFDVLAYENVHYKHNQLDLYIQLKYHWLQHEANKHNKTYSSL